ncbi:MAG: lipoyl synthase [Deltaproteobacteria bacterium]|jgi:lipoyl synthase|nr:lipoyl synthase [Deltaproteobacteria bacterium]
MESRYTGISRSRLPSWLRKTLQTSTKIHEIKSKLRSKKLHSVCEEAKCPNLCECFERGTATIMIMGRNCTRHCGFCAIKNGEPTPLDPDEPQNVAQQIKEMELRHAVITSVTRDDLPDGGAAHFARTIEAAKKSNPETAIEVLTPDFEGRALDVMTVCHAGPNIFNHNLETVERLTPYIRNKAKYARSLGVLRAAREGLPKGLIKSGLMVGLGEMFEEVERTLSDLKSVGCDIVTIGQYLRPNKKAIPVAEYIPPEIFRRYQTLQLKYGFKMLFAGPFVRSSYLADKVTLEG